MIKTDLSAWFVNIAFAVLSFRGVYSLTGWFIFIFRSTNERSVSFKSVCKSSNRATINEFTETQKFISTSEGFSSRLEENFPALILLFPPSKIWKITRNTGKVSYNFKCLSHSDNAALWVTPNVFPHSDDSLQIVGRNRKCSSEIAAKSGRLKSTLSTITEHPREQWKCCLRKIHELRKAKCIHINE